VWWDRNRESCRHAAQDKKTRNDGREARKEKKGSGLMGFQLKGANPELQKQIKNITRIYFAYLGHHAI
jgi:hypothetical protein